ncbi:colicin immunity domain-containing protein [Actinorugispora endophytica]|uniref:Self-protective colicin-like immunity protein n=1 Tax=Actinorugispora endophytica TaxID=1605990 RepID=A0A4R6V4Y8_9ACTN|nr:colicin immunity domain-containing protein [Actinorugispora endophytica]TDQ55401.1 self-protective colicin-like immunity protein [Actinorugispora endophytica]
MDIPLAPYADLARSYVEGEIEARAFETAFLRLFKTDERLFGPADYEALEELFWAVDSYCADPELRDERDLDEPQLRRYVQDFLDRISA